MTLVSPTKRPQEFGFKEGDTHIVINGQSNTATAFSFGGQKLWKIPCLPDGQSHNWRVPKGDTVPGLYKVGQVYNDYAVAGDHPYFDRTLMEYGWVSFDLIELEGQEKRYGRAGIMMHGGGSANGWPKAWDPYQTLCTTYGCVRFYNQDLRDRILPLAEKGSVFISVYQDE